jgi:phosphatidyl-myo-inositol dimannoside synthase
MPSRGEGFGFVFLEAMACGIPAIASRVDGSRDASADGVLAELVNPGDARELIQATSAALEKPRQVPGTLRRFAFGNFSAHIRRIILTCQKQP